MKKVLLIIAVAFAGSTALTSCSSSTECKTCTISGSSIEYCPSQAPSGVSGDQYMSAAQQACSAADGTWE